MRKLKCSSMVGWAQLALLLFLTIILMAMPAMVFAQSEDDADDADETDTDTEDAQADETEEPAEPESEDPALTPPPNAPDPDAEPPKKDPPFGNYGKMIQHYQDMLLGLDLWGSTSTIPQGALVPMIGWGTQRPYGRFNENRNLIELLPILSVPDPFFDKGDYFFEFDFNPSGSMQGYLFGLMYGINDRMMVGANIMGVILDIKIDPIFTPGTCERLGVATLEEFYTMLELLGRPRPATRYRTEGLDLGDLTLSYTWNYYRNDWFSSGFTTNLFVPTSHRADPDKNLIFGLGPEMDTGNGAWGLGLAKMVDFRPPDPVKFVTFSFGVEGAYYFDSKRESPHFIKPDQTVWDYLAAQGVELDFLPDLSDMDSHYYYRPPPWFALSGGIGIGPLSVTYRHGWGFEADFQSNSPGFQKMIDEIGLVGTGDDGKLIFATMVPLTPIYIPAIVQLRMEYVTDGKNNIVFRDIYQVGMGFLIPLNMPDKYKFKPGDK